MKAAELRGQTADQLRDELSKLKKEALNLRFQAATGELQNTNRKRQVRRDIARITTVLKQEPAGEKAKAAPKKAAAKAKAKPAKKPAAKKTDEKAKG